MKTPTLPSFDPLHPPDYVERTHHVLAVEREGYLKERRQRNGLPPLSDDNIVGLAISGGGIRSATLGLGLLQAFIRADVLKLFDYLSTVSGGGYIGACLSSLLSREPNTVKKYSAEPNVNERYRVEEMGLGPKDCPLSPETAYEYAPLERTRLSAKHQLLHLRRYGEYLTPRPGILGWDVSRAVGTVVSGLLIHISLFLLALSAIVLLHHVLFATLSDGYFIDHLEKAASFYNQQHPSEQPIPETHFKGSEEWDKLSAGDKLIYWASHYLWPQIYLIVHAVERRWELAFLFFLLGCLVVVGAILYARRIPIRVTQMESEESRFKDPTTDHYYDRPGGQNLFQYVAKPFEKSFLFIAYLLGPALSYAVCIALFQMGYLRDREYFIIMALPACFAAGLTVVSIGLISLYLINHRAEPVAGRMYRSFYTGIQGSSFLGWVTALALPIIILLLFGKHGLLTRLLFSFIPVAVAYYITAQSLAGKSGIQGVWQAFLRKVQKPLLNFSIFLLVGVALAGVSTALFELEAQWTSHPSERLVVTLALSAIALVLLVLLGFAANSNDISLHYFYRDRLTEAFLRTDGRVERNPAEDLRSKRVHPKGLFDVTLRNHENLRIANLGDGNEKGPYHLIVGALNLQGTEDLAQKTLRSDHFIFSKFFVGSRTTGYYYTKRYRNGHMKLNTAMTISAAAVASGMGFMGFAASNFYLTLLNLRTGYWIDNPWFLHKEAEAEQRARLEASIWPRLRARLARLARRYPFWLLYLLREMTGTLHAKTRRVYVSDGGHTGGNLGLIPLLQRRCCTIVVGDFEEDASYAFASLNQAIRLAKSIYNIDIHIDLSPLLPTSTRSDTPYAPCCITIGKICYPETPHAPALEGKLIYLKPSLPDPTVQSELSTYVRNYARAYPKFPHESTADQYFDENQFEAYRMLGDYLGRQAVPHLQL